MSKVGKQSTASSAKSNRQHPVSSEIIEELLQGLQLAAEEIALRFFDTMPSSYFHDTDQEMRLSHLKAVIAAEASGISQTITLSNKDRTHYTFISDRSYPGQLSKFVRRLPRGRPLYSAQVYTATDGKLVLDVFDLGARAPFAPDDSQQSAKIALVLEHLQDKDIELQAEKLIDHFNACAANYLLTTSPAQIYRHYSLVQRIRCSGNALVELGQHPDHHSSAITVGVINADRRLLFERITRYLGQQGIDIQRAYLDSFDLKSNETISLLSFLVEFAGQAIDPQGDTWSRIEPDLKRLVYLDDTVLKLAQDLADADLLHAEVLVALSHLTHQRLVKQGVLTYSRERILQTLIRYPALALAIATHFIARFTPESGCDLPEDSAHLREQIGLEVDNQDEAEILTTLLAAADATLRSNIHTPDRYALALRIDPVFLQAAGREEPPFGVFFIHGRQFDGFHVRFRDIARGGIRIVRPGGQEQYALESERLYDEVYGLAHAQQLKNKDIPEGGSKGVILAQPQANFTQVGRAYADALLDLIVPDPELKRINVDYLGRDELLYLGPDENISNELITWIVERARHRNHPMPDAFMSSKPGAGINHKLYGVTSEGVTVFLEAALRNCGIDPRRQSFTVKMTGGPDGDVAGNEIRILRREYGENARILGIADGSGCVEDPDGLDHAELLRLVDEELPVGHFNTERLGPNGRLLGIDQAGGIQARNSLHCRIQSDAFIPAGGRPRTINGENWHDFLTDTGKPSSRVIVEGANLFITPKARQQLSRQGVTIIKDSSANKCGVICSSYEIVASMLLNEADFLRIKTRFIEDVLIKLRKLAALEAQTLFREHRHKPELTLPELSTRMSRVIDRATDAITRVIDTLEESGHELTRRLVKTYLPAVLHETVGEQFFERIPPAYLTRVIASVLASHIVYREGLDWFEQMPERAIAELAVRYLHAEESIRQLVEQVSNSDLPDRDRIAELLREGGVGAALRTTAGSV